MGRPQDDFCWENAVKVSGGRWRCKHCNAEYSGTAARIRRHLSGQGGGIGLCKDVPPNIRDRAVEEVLNKLSTNNISKGPRLSSSSVGEDYNDGIINVDRQGGAIIGNTTVVAHVTQLFQGGCSSSARLINVADVADVTERRETNEDPNLMTQRDNDDVNVDSRGVMMSNSAAHHPFGPIFARGNQIPQQQGQGSGEPSNDDPQQQEERQTPRDDYSWKKYGTKSTGKHKPSANRDYYRCSDKGCQVKKKVEKISDDEKAPRYRITYRGHHTCIDLSTPPVLPGLRRSSAAANRKEQSSITTSNNSDDDNNTQAAMASSTSPGYFSLGDNPGLDSQGLPSTVVEKGEQLEYVEENEDPLYDDLVITRDEILEPKDIKLEWKDIKLEHRDSNSSPLIPKGEEFELQHLSNFTVKGEEFELQHLSNFTDQYKLPNDMIMKELKDCFYIFFLLPTDYEFEEDSLVQLWMARGCIKDESVGHARFHSLLNGQYLLHSGTNFVTRKASYRMNTTKIDDLLDGQKDINGSFYLQWENDSQKNITSSAEIQHVSLVCNDIDASIFLTLQQFAELRTLLFLRNYGNKVTQVQDHLFLSCQKLQALDLSGTHIKKLSSFVGNLIHLRYLDLSWTLIEWLPDTICSLDELQTLKLKGCVKLRGLPRQLKKLTKLRHLDVDVLRQLATLPAGIGALVNLRTLSAFLVGSEDGCKIQELKELNSIKGDFCIAMLENVGNGDEANEAALINKQYLDKLELRWTASQLLRTNNNCYDVLKCLRPCSTLKELQIFCYEGSTFPDWVSDPAFYQLTSVTFFNCEHVSELPLIEQLPFLKHLELVKMNGVKKIERRGKLEQAAFFRLERQAAFFRLERLEVNEMQSLRSWNWAPTSEGDFKSLVELTISDCPSLSEFHVLPCLSSIKHLEVKGCPKLESLSDTKLPDSLEELIVEDCPMINRKCSQQGGEDWYKIQHVSNIRICEDDEDDDHDEC